MMAFCKKCGKEQPIVGILIGKADDKNGYYKLTCEICAKNTLQRDMDGKSTR